MPGIPPRSVRHLLQPQHTPGQQSPYVPTPPPKPSLVASTEATPQPAALYVFEDWSPSAQSSYSCGVSEPASAPVPVGSSPEPVPAGPSSVAAAAGSSSEPVPAGSSSELLPAGSSSEPVPARSSSEPVPTRSSSEPVPARSSSEPVPAGSSSEAVPAGSSSEAAAAAGSSSSEVDDLRERVTALGAALEVAEKRGALLARQKQRLQEQVQRLQSQPPTPQPAPATAPAPAAGEEEEEERAGTPTRLPAELSVRLEAMATALTTHRERLVLEVGALRARAEAAERAAADARARAASREGAHRGAAAPSPCAAAPAAAAGEPALGHGCAPEGLAHWWDSFGSEYGGEAGKSGEAGAPGAPGAAGLATPCGTGGLTTPSAASWSGRTHGSGAIADGDAWSSPEVRQALVAHGRRCFEELRSAHRSSPVAPRFASPLGRPS